MNGVIRCVAADLELELLFRPLHTPPTAAAPSASWVSGCELADKSLAEPRWILFHKLGVHVNSASHSPGDYFPNWVQSGVIVEENNTDADSCLMPPERPID